MLNNLTLRKRIFIFSSLLLLLAFTLIWIFVRPQYKEAIINERTTIVSQLQEYSLQRSDQIIRNWLNASNYMTEQISESPAQTQDIMSRTLNLTPGLMRITITEDGSTESVDIRRSIYDEVNFSGITYQWMPSKLDPDINVSFSNDPVSGKYFLVAQKAIQISQIIYFVDMYFDATAIVNDLIQIPLGGNYSANLITEGGRSLLPSENVLIPESALNDAGYSDLSTSNIDGKDWFILSSRFETLPYWHTVAVEDTFILKPVYDLITYSLVTGAVILLILFSFSWYVSRRVNKPVEQIISDVEYMSTLNFEHPIQPVTLPEFSLMQTTLENIRLTLERYQRINVEKIILEEWKNRYMMTYSEDLIGILDSNRKFSFINNNFKQLLESMQLDPDMAHLDDIINHNDISLTKLEQRVHNPDPYTVKISNSELAHFQNENKSDYYDYQYVSIIDRDDKEQAALIILHDKTEDRLNDIKRNDMINIIAHELKNPITSIMGLSEVLQDSTFTDKKERENLLNEILLSGRRMKTLVNRFLDIQRIESGRANIEFKKIDLYAIVEEVKSVNHPLLLQKGVDAEIVREGRGFNVKADRDLVFDAVQNLLSNAIKYGEPGRTIEIKVANRPESVKLSVTDYGYGISLEEQKKIFDKFYRVKSNKKAARENGTGLGLAYVREIINIHNGEIELESNEAIGSRFTLIFPK
ncbi:ATP-binding protein [Gracilimonas sp. Q87]|uniref:sensor histidine kinase n=1 Tax=Gracilimonas sp. Q87 TaxID=3384766 RepID=UPI003983F3A4